MPGDMSLQRLRTSVFQENQCLILAELSCFKKHKLTPPPPPQGPSVYWKGTEMTLFAKLFQG